MVLGAPGRKNVVDLRDSRVPNPTRRAAGCPIPRGHAISGSSYKARWPFLSVFFFVVQGFALGF